jgi:hypothetical protein
MSIHQVRWSRDERNVLKFYKLSCFNPESDEAQREQFVGEKNYASYLETYSDGIVHIFSFTFKLELYERVIHFI